MKHNNRELAHRAKRLDGNPPAPASIRAAESCTRSIFDLNGRKFTYHFFGVRMCQTCTEKWCGLMETLGMSVMIVPFKIPGPSRNVGVCLGHG